MHITNQRARTIITHGCWVIALSCYKQIVMICQCIQRSVVANSLGPGDGIWCHETLVRVLLCWLRAPSHSRTWFWLISEVLLHLPVWLSLKMLNVSQYIIQMRLAITYSKLHLHTPVINDLNKALGIHAVRTWNTQFDTTYVWTVTFGKDVNGCYK